MQRIIGLKIYVDPKTKPGGSSYNINTWEIVRQENYCDLQVTWAKDCESALKPRKATKLKKNQTSPKNLQK